MAAAPAPGPEGHKPKSSVLALLLSHHVAVLALGAGLGSAVMPLWTELKAWRLGVAVNQLQIARDQETLWRRNLACIAQSSSWEIDGPRSLVVKVTICDKTGDALLRYFANDWAPTYRWVRAPETGETP